uniref:Uncharacterized protein n=1 Tax=Encephalitozoon cuniculi TaxID=6035 RepID=M1K971_ENCCN|nr:hypothetical protein ECU06_0520 [Encephalitozoon cuniculi]
MKRVDGREMERRLSFVLKGRDSRWDGSCPVECSRVFVVEGHRAILSGTVLFLDEKKLEEDVIYLSKDGARIVATKCNEIVILDISEYTIKRVETKSQIRRGEVWNEYLGILLEDGRLEVFKDGKYMHEEKDVRDFLLPDSLVTLDGKFMSHENVRRILRSADGSGIIVVSDEKLVLGDNEVENMLHRGDMEYDRGIAPCYYHCNFHGVNLLASSNSSRFLLLGGDLHELELDEEIKLLGLRTDEEFNVRYLTGMDHSGRYVYLIDEDGVLSKFEACGIEGERETEEDIEFTEKRYSISREEGLISTNGGNEGLLAEPMGKKKSLSSLAGLLDSVEEDNVSMEDNRTQGDENASCTELTGDGRVDALVERIASQIDEITKDFEGIKVEKKAFRMYRYNANDLSLSVEQAYKNIMRLERYRSIGDEMAEQLSMMLNSLEVYEGIDEESIRNAVRYVDSAIEGISKGRRRRVVHYTKPLLYGIGKVGGVDLGLDRKTVEVQKTLTDADCIEMKMDNDTLDEGFKHHFNLNQASIESAPEEKGERPPSKQEDASPERMEDGREESNEIRLNAGEAAPVERAYPSLNTHPVRQTNIFGQTVSKNDPVQFGGLFSSSSPSNIFQSITNNPPQVPQALEKKEEDPSQSVPNAFSRFANSRSLFK